MFMSVFPAAVTWGFIANLVMVILTEKAYSTIARRSLSVELETIGVWNQIIEVMCFTSTFVNAMLNVYTSNSLTLDLSTASYDPLFFVICVEHFIIGLKFLLGRVIPDFPYAIFRRLENAKQLEIRAKEKREQLKKRRKMKKLYDRLDSVEKGKLKGFNHFIKDHNLRSLPMEIIMEKMKKLAGDEKEKGGEGKINFFKTII